MMMMRYCRVYSSRCLCHTATLCWQGLALVALQRLDGFLTLVYHGGWGLTSLINQMEIELCWGLELGSPLPDPNPFPTQALRSLEPVLQLRTDTLL
jgi:hypothetical protein